jgi:hypothetical protein
VQERQEVAANLSRQDSHPELGKTNETLSSLLVMVRSHRSSLIAHPEGNVYLTPFFFLSIVSPFNACLATSS